MKSTGGQFVFAVILVAGCTTGQERPGFTPLPDSLDFPASEDLWSLVWFDEFEATEFDTTQWSYQVGDGCDIDLCGWGNNELQWYTRENLGISDGELIITAARDSSQRHLYTSSRIRTRHKGDWKYGRIDVRASLPAGRGIWPAIWMLPSENTYGSWAASGEIDIMESIGNHPDRVYGTLHHGGRWPDNEQSGDSLIFATGDIRGYHVYSIIWDEVEIAWYVDGEHYQTQTEWHTTDAPFPAPFDQQFHLVMNVAIGGNWPGYPDETTTFPQEMKVDYVRVYHRASRLGEQ